MRIIAFFIFASLAFAAYSQNGSTPSPVKPQQFDGCTIDIASKNANPAPYPEAASSAGIEGTAILIVDIDKSALVRNVLVEKSTRNRDLDRSAVDAARKWKYVCHGAATLEGGRVRVPVSFRIPGNDQSNVRELGRSNSPPVTRSTKPTDLPANAFLFPAPTTGELKSAGLELDETPFAFEHTADAEAFILGLPAISLSKHQTPGVRLYSRDLAKSKAGETTESEIWILAKTADQSTPDISAVVRVRAFLDPKSPRGYQKKYRLLCEGEAAACEGYSNYLTLLVSVL